MDCIGPIAIATSTRLPTPSIRISTAARAIGRTADVPRVRSQPARRTSRHAPVDELHLLIDGEDRRGVGRSLSGYSSGKQVVDYPRRLNAGELLVEALEGKHELIMFET
jgi:hypothetical protein